MITTVLEVLIVGGIAAAVLVAGFRIGMLVAPRITRRVDREEGTDDRTD